MSALRKLAASAGALVVLALAGLMLAPALLGYERYVITTGSMTGTYDPGSIVYDKVVPVSDLKVGDAITYAPPAGSAPTDLVTHRIVSIKRDSKGRQIFRTKGDANQSADPWRFQLNDSKQARVAYSVPFAGRAVMALADRQTRMIVIGIPALLVALLALAGVVRDVRRERESATSVVGGLEAVAEPPHGLDLGGAGMTGELLAQSADQ